MILLIFDLFSEGFDPSLIFDLFSEVYDLSLIFDLFSEGYDPSLIMDGHLTPEYIDENGMYDGNPYM